MTTNDRPKPAPPKPRPTTETPQEEFKKALVESEKQKPKFVRKPHLTERPFRAHEGLQALKKTMDTPKKPQRRGQRRTK